MAAVGRTVEAAEIDTGAEPRMPWPLDPLAPERLGHLRAEVGKATQRALLGAVALRQEPELAQHRGLVPLLVLLDELPVTEEPRFR